MNLRSLRDSAQPSRAIKRVDKLAAITKQLPMGRNIRGNNWHAKSERLGNRQIESFGK